MLYCVLSEPLGLAGCCTPLTHTQTAWVPASQGGPRSGRGMGEKCFAQSKKSLRPSWSPGTLLVAILHCCLFYFHTAKTPQSWAQDFWQRCAGWWHQPPGAGTPSRAQQLLCYVPLPITLTQETSCQRGEERMTSPLSPVGGWGPPGLAGPLPSQGTLFMWRTKPCSLTSVMPQPGVEGAGQPSLSPCLSPELGGRPGPVPFFSGADILKRGGAWGPAVALFVVCAECSESERALPYLIQLKQSQMGLHETGLPSMCWGLSRGPTVDRPGAGALPTAASAQAQGGPRPPSPRPVLGQNCLQCS